MPVITGITLTADSETAPAKLPRLETAIGSKPGATKASLYDGPLRTEDVHSGTQPETATARTGLYWVSTTRQASSRG
jgi:hypothetical protein